jgi:hypothetical protein
MGPLAARKAVTIADNVAWILALEWLCASQAREFHRDLRAGKGAEAAYALLREHVKPLGSIATCTRTSRRRASSCSTDRWSKRSKRRWGSSRRERDPSFRAARACRGGLQEPTSSKPDAARPEPAASAHSYTVDELIAAVERSNARFDYIVDDKMYVANGKQMAEHLRAKYVAAGNPEITPERFIKRYATESDSEGWGSKYHVRLADGSHIELADWLRAQLPR